MSHKRAGLSGMSCVAAVLGAAFMASPILDAEEPNRLSQILAGDAFDQLGQHGRSVTLYLAAAQARSWDEAHPLLRRIWREYPDSTAVDMAYAFAARRYRDRGQTEQAILYFDKALEAARERGRPWTDILIRELEKLRLLYAQAPGPPQPQPAGAPEVLPVPPVGDVGEWVATTGIPVAVSVGPDAVVMIDVEVVEPRVIVPASFVVKQDLVATGASLRLKVEPGIKHEVQFVDADGTAAVARSSQFAPDEQGWRQVGIEFAELPNSGPGNFVMERLSTIGVYLACSRMQAGAKVRVLLSDLVLRLGDPVRMADAPEGDAAFERRPTNTDESGATWMPFGVTVGEEIETVHDGPTSMRLSTVIDELGGRGSGGHANLIPPADAPWLGGRLVFWCFPRDIAFLPVIVNSKNKVQLSAVLGPEDLKVGQWNRAEILFEKAHQTTTTQGETFGEIVSVIFVPHTSWDLQHEYLKEPGEYVWYIDDVHVEGDGPVRLERAVKSILDLGLEMAWSVKGNCTIEPEAETVDMGEGSARLTVELDDTEGSGGSAIARPPDGRPWPATGIAFTCLAATAPVLSVFAQDSDGTSVAWTVDDTHLVLGEWSVVTLSPEGRVNIGGGDEVMNDIVLLVVGCHRGKLPAHSVLPPLGPVTWYLDSFTITNDQPIPVKPHPARPQAGQAVRDDTGLPLAWVGYGRAAVERELVVVREGAYSVKLTVSPGRPGSRRLAVVEGRLPQPRETSEISFWLWPTARGPLTLTATDTGEQVALWTIPADDLVAQDWNQISLSLSNARVVDGEQTPQPIPPEQFGPVRYIRFALSASVDSPQERRTWYIDSVKLMEREEGS